MTQGDFADRLGVTAQAVSKWENDLSYPDITLIPTIATIFNVEENDLFGFKRKNAKTDYHFPKSYDGMTLVHHFQNIACYSTKTVASIDGSGVKFTDGSSAELSNRLVVNTGKGEIKLLAVDDARQDLDFDQDGRGLRVCVRRKHRYRGHRQQMRDHAFKRRKMPCPRARRRGLYRHP